MARVRVRHRARGAGSGGVEEDVPVARAQQRFGSQLEHLVALDEKVEGLQLQLGEISRHQRFPQVHQEVVRILWEGLGMTKMIVPLVPVSALYAEIIGHELPRVQRVAVGGPGVRLRHLLPCLTPRKQPLVEISPQGILAEEFWLTAACVDEPVVPRAPMQRLLNGNGTAPPFL